jgi:hypothetical protein
MNVANFLWQDSTSAFGLSLNEVLDVYLQLHRNDGLEEIAPLSLTLTLQLKFTSSFSMFKQAADSGQGMSTFSFLQASGDDHNYEEGREWDGHEADEQAATEEYDENAYTGHYQGDEADFHEGDEDHQPGTEHYQEDSQDYYYDEAAEGDYHEGDQGEAAEALDGLTGHSAEEAYHDFQDPGDEYARHHPEHEDTAVPAPKDNVQSAASSTTVQGDLGALGEFYSDEEIIFDWDDDTLTSDLSDNTATTTGQDDSTSNTKENTAEAPKANIDDKRNLASEYFLNEFPEHHKAENQEHIYQEFHEDGDYGQDRFDDTDNLLPAQHHVVDEDAVAAQKGTQPGKEEIHFQPADEENFLEGNDHEYIDFNEDADQQLEEEDEFDDTVLIHRPDEAEAEEGGSNELSAHGYEDDLNFDEDEDDTEASHPPVKPHSNGSPLGKRSFDEIEEEDVDSPDVKKVKAS